MPNGRSGGFVLDTADLRLAIAASPQAEVVADVVSGSTRLKPATASELISLVDQCERPQVAVEEQDGDSYIIHITNEPMLWVVVGAKSSLLAPLRQHHSRWRAQHPDWNGWIAF